MVFSSTMFLFVFLPLVLMGYYLIRKDLRNIFLLTVSLAFYASSEVRYVLIMIASIMINYSFGLLIDFAKNRGTKILNRSILFLAVSLNLGILFYFKYMDFFISTANNLLGLNLKLLHILLPVGISFFTFQGMSYTLDLYMGKVEVQKNFINLALYIALFPQLIAGPIVRYIDVNDEIESRTVSIDKFAYGIERFIYGLAKKVIIANQVGYIADQIFNSSINQINTGIAWLGIICYTLQIYFDFSGYSDMAIGLGKMFGFTFLENFNYPYVATSITDFWRRWHISLSSWFRDYVYIPLGGNRKGNMYFNLLVVFFVTGMWHGAAWNFIIWGLWHGLFLIAEKVMKNRDWKFKVPKVMSWAVTMLIVMIGWVLFRSVNLEYAIEYIKILFGGSSLASKNVFVLEYLNLKVVTVIIVGTLVSCRCKINVKKIKRIYEDTYFELVLSKCIQLILFGISIIMTIISTYNPFIYFRF